MITHCCFVFQEEQPLAALIALTQHLEGARFQAFWVAVDSCRDIVKSGEQDACEACSPVRRQILLNLVHCSEVAGLSEPKFAMWYCSARLLRGREGIHPGRNLQHLSEGHKSHTG